MRASITAAIALSAVALALTSPASATAISKARGEETIRTTVHFGDLDLQTHAGANALYSRLNEAAGRVCSDATDPYARLTPAYHTCRKDALSAAVHEINSPLVTQTFDQHSKRA